MRYNGDIIWYQTETENQAKSIAIMKWQGVSKLFIFKHKCNKKKVELRILNYYYYNYFLSINWIKHEYILIHVCVYSINFSKYQF